MARYYRFAAFLIIILGTIQCGFTPAFHKSFNADTILFFGSGLSYIFMGLYNLAVLKVNIRTLNNFAVILNFIGTVFTFAIVYIMREPQSFLALAIVIFLFLNSVYIKR